MRAELLKGAPVAAAIRQRLLCRTAELSARGIVPTLAIFRVGERSEDLSYEKSIRARCRELGVEVRLTALPQDVSQTQALDSLQALNRDSSVHGIIMLRPLPAQLDEPILCSVLRPYKDLDGVAVESLFGVFTGSSQRFSPCTAQACMEILSYYGFCPAGKKVAVVGRSLVVGRPAAALALSQDATVTICHSKTSDLPNILRQADIIIAAAGKPLLLGADCFSPGQIVVDVGIHSLPDGSLCGDADFAAAVTTVRAITPVPGGVGPVTSWVLMEHLLHAAAECGGSNT